jgi:hypothetical protein
MRTQPTIESETAGAFYPGHYVNLEGQVIFGTGSKKGWRKISGQELYISLDWLK